MKMGEYAPGGGGGGEGGIQKRDKTDGDFESCTTVKIIAQPTGTQMNYYSALSLLITEFVDCLNRKHLDSIQNAGSFDFPEVKREQVHYSLLL